MNISLDKDAAVNALLYIANNISDSNCFVNKYKLLKILYFAEKKHVSKYGRFITGDTFFAPEHGPVPSFCYDLTKSGNPNLFSVVDAKTLVPLQKPDIDYLSESDIECIDESIKENRNLGFGELKNKSHDSAYNETPLDNKINFDSIAKASGVSEQLLDYMNLYYSHKQP